MEFYLTYEGPLKANGSPKDKQAIREYLRPQLECLWDSFPLNEYKDLLNSSSSSCVLKSIDNITFAPLVTKAVHLTCALDITMLDSADSFGQKGDIDNRLKTLFDALTCPDTNQIKALDDFNKREYFCTLLEDDKLITSITVKTSNLLKITNDKSVFVLIRVNTKPYKSTWDNIGL